MTTTTATTISREGEDFLSCSCGNASHLDGFACCDINGTAREGEYGPTPEWNGRTMACLSCGSVFDMASLAVYPDTYLA